MKAELLSQGAGKSLNIFNWFRQAFGQVTCSSSGHQDIHHKTRFICYRCQYFCVIDNFLLQVLKSANNLLISQSINSGTRCLMLHLGSYLLLPDTEGHHLVMHQILPVTRRLPSEGFCASID